MPVGAVGAVAAANITGHLLCTTTTAAAAAAAAIKKENRESGEMLLKFLDWVIDYTGLILQLREKSVENKG